MVCGGRHGLRRVPATIARASAGGKRVESVKQQCRAATPRESAGRCAPAGPRDARRARLGSGLEAALLRRDVLSLDRVRRT